MSDTRVIEFPKFIWKIILHGIILRIRPKRSAKTYKTIWTDEGSPLLNIAKKQIELVLDPLNKCTTELEYYRYLDVCESGISIGLISDAGCPGIADPGAVVVALAHQKNIQVVPLVGPSSLLMALMASGLNGQQFTFHGYLPIAAKERNQAIKKLERSALQHQQTQLFIETPYRNISLLEALIQQMQPSTLLTLACDLSLSS